MVDMYNSSKCKLMWHWKLDKRRRSNLFNKNDTDLLAPLVSILRIRTRMCPVTFLKPFIFLNNLLIRGELLKAYEIDLMRNVFQFNMMESSQRKKNIA